MPVIAVVFHTEQPRIFHIGIGQHIAGCCAVHKPSFYQKPNKPALGTSNSLAVVLRLVLCFKSMNRS